MRERFPANAEFYSFLSGTCRYSDDIHAWFFFMIVNALRLFYS